MSNKTTLEFRDLVSALRGITEIGLDEALLKKAINLIASNFEELADKGIYITPKEALETVAGARPLDAILKNPPFANRAEGGAATQGRETITVEKKDWLELPRNINLKRFVNTSRETHFIGQYTDANPAGGNPNPRRVYTIDVIPLGAEDLAAAGLPPIWEVGVHEDGKLLFKIVTNRGRAVAEYLGVKALKAWLNYCGSKRRGKQSRKTHNKRNRANRRARKAAMKEEV